MVNGVTGEWVAKSTSRRTGDTNAWKHTHEKEKVMW